MLSPFQKSKLSFSHPSWDKPEKPKADIISTYEGLTGNQVKRISSKATLVLCPFHEERNPSFALYPQTESYFCFACGKAGDAFSLIMQLEKVDFKDALEIAKKYER